MLIAIPVSNNKLDSHFGHCKEFALVKTDSKNKKIILREDIKAPPHQPDMLPFWLAQLGVEMVIAGGMGHRARELFINYKIKVLVGASKVSPENLVNDYMNEVLMLGANSCDH